MRAAIAATLLATSFVVGPVAGAAAADHPAVQTATDASAPDGRLIVVWRKPIVAGAAMRIAGVSREKRAPNSMRSVVFAAAGQSAAVAARLRADSAVASVTPDSLRHLADFPATPPNDTYYASYQADLVKMRVPSAWLTTLGSSSQVVAVLDTGMMRTHEDLDAVPVVSPWNAISGTTDVTDGAGHGTHVIGEIAAETNNGIGIAGIAPGVTIMPVKVCGDDGSCWTSDLENGIDWARSHGATVINMSLGGESPTALEQSVITNAYNAGITIVAAAGNDGNGTVDYPASYANVLSVAATDDSDLHASFSNANTAVDLAAPGVNIASTYNNGGYALLSGTSMSTPHVAAVAALVRSAHPTFGPLEVEQALRATAVDLGAPGRDDVFGSGRVDAAAAVVYGDPTPPPPPPPVVTTAFTIHAGESITLEQAGLPGAVFDFESSPDLATWGLVLTRTIGSGGTVDFTFAPRQTAYYRSVFSDGSSDPVLGVVIPDAIRPTISHKTPAAGKIGADRDGNVKITFSEKVLHVSKTTVRLVNSKTGSVLRLKSFKYDAATHALTLDPYFRLAASKTYRVEVKAGITDIAGNTLAATKWTFKTGLR